MPGALSSDAHALLGTDRACGAGAVTAATGCVTGIVRLRAALHRNQATHALMINICCQLTCLVSILRCRKFQEKCWSMGFASWCVHVELPPVLLPECLSAPRYTTPTDTVVLRSEAARPSGGIAAPASISDEVSAAAVPICGSGSDPSSCLPPAVVREMARGEVRQKCCTCLPMSVFLLRV